MKPRLTARRRAGIALLAVYVAGAAAANWLTTRYGLVPVFAFGLMAPAGTAVIGAVIMTRDLLQDALGRIAVLAAIGLGAGLSLLLASPQIAVASGVTFLIAESLEFAVYTPLRRRVGWGTGRWGGVVGLANITGALADTLIFLTLAGFPVTWQTVGGQMAGKAYVTVAVVAAALGIRWLIRRRHQVTVRLWMPVTKDCPYKAETDEGTLGLAIRGDAPELHGLAERIAAIPQQPISHEDYTRAVRALLPRGSRVTTTWHTGPWDVEVTSGAMAAREARAAP